jgi:hypothetical protein
MLKDLGIAILGIALLGGIIWAANRYAAREPAGDGLRWLDRLRDFWHDLSARADASPAPAMAGPATAPRTAPSPVRPAAPDPGQAGPAPARPPMPPPPAALPPAADAPPGAPSAGGAQSDLLYAANALAAEASHGDIHAVRRVDATFAAVATELGSALTRLGQRLSEPDKRYGPEIWEPVMQAGAQCKAAGIHLGEADANTLSLINTTLGELANSPRQSPHHSQMDGGA